MEPKVNHFLMVPFTGLGLFQGFRGSRWLKNRIKVFEQFVIPSLKAQTNKNFIIWIAWRYEEKNNSIVKEFCERLNRISDLKFVQTYSGIPFWDDKYPDKIAHKRLVEALHGAMGDLLNVMNESDTILMTVQPSDDCYRNDMVEQTQKWFQQNNHEAIVYTKGYVMDYVKMRLAEWNPTTTPPFYTIKFNRENFGTHHPLKHLEYTGPYKSHEYVKDNLNTFLVEERGFIVGIHGDNISTVFDHPFTGEDIYDPVHTISKFGLLGVKPLEIQVSIRKKIMNKLPQGWQKKLRYLLGERFYSKIYDWIRS